MFETITPRSAAEFTQGRERIESEMLIRAIATSNTELKILTQASLVQGHEVPLTTIRTDLHDACDGSEPRSVTTGHINRGHIIRVVQEMDDQFVRVVGERGNFRAVLSTDGHDVSAAMGGHLINLAVDTNVPLRRLIGENLSPKKLPGKKSDIPEKDNEAEDVEVKKGTGSIEARIKILTALWQHASVEWMPAPDLLVATQEVGIAERVVRRHVTKLIKIGILERRKPDRQLPSERSLRGYLYRIKQESGHIPPTEVVDRYLGIILLSSIRDPEFIRQGIGHLKDIGQDPTYVPDLIDRSFAHTGHTGKKRRAAA
ncbi:MAG TPA: hypothetical protein VIH90_04150 [Candidatus Saccharimonadales bacterium]